MKTESPLDKPIYALIRDIVRQIPAGRVATYGQIASIAGKCTPRMVGYTMSGLPKGSDVPWQRVVNAAGEISPRGNFESTLIQRDRLEAEGITFQEDGSIKLDDFLWAGPEWGWLVEQGLNPEI